MDETNFEKNKEKIAQIIKSKAVNLQCPTCGNQNMILGGGYFAHDLQKDLISRTMGPLNIPVIPIICSNCGLVREFAVGVLGLLPNKNEQEKNEKGIQ